MTTAWPRRIGVLQAVVLVGALAADALARDPRESTTPVPIAAPGIQATPLARVPGPGVDFRIGRDNLAFPNPDGVLHRGGWRGNCTGMAIIAKLFLERARFEPPDRSRPGCRGFDLLDLQSALRRPTERFRVLDYRGLFDLTSGAIDLRGDGKALPPAGEVLQLVTAAHYLSWIPLLGPTTIEGLAATGEGRLPELSKRSARAIKDQLRRGRTALVSLRNLPGPEAPGHTVLAYRVDENARHDDFHVYDSNVQHGSERAESIWRVSHDGSRVAILILPPDGALQRDHRYSGVRWWYQASTRYLSHVPEPLYDAFLEQVLAGQVVQADRLTSWLSGLQDVMGGPAR